MIDTSLTKSSRPERSLDWDAGLDKLRLILSRIPLVDRILDREESASGKEPLFSISAKNRMLPVLSEIDLTRLPSLESFLSVLHNNDIDRMIWRPIFYERNAQMTEQIAGGLRELSDDQKKLL
jgi:hypothetical protein